jgi:hypothetical protein
LKDLLEGKVPVNLKNEDKELKEKALAVLAEFINEKMSSEDFNQQDNQYLKGFINYKN